MPDLIDLMRRSEPVAMPAGRASIIRAQALAVVKQSGGYGCTPDECAATLGLTVLAVRSRFTELRQAGAIKPNGSRRKNQSGCTAKVWVATNADEGGQHD